MKFAKLDIVLLLITLLAGFVGIASNENPLSHRRGNSPGYPYPYPYPYAYPPPATFTCASVTEIPLQECEALVSLYNRTNGPHWKNQTNWLRSKNPSQWYGVSVSGGHVYGLSLGANYLYGSLPPKLGNLTNLSWLYLDRNHLTDSIPVELASLTDLMYLDLSYNQLTGVLSPELGGIANLVYLRLQGNQLSGSIPGEFGNLTNLRELYLAGNQLTGPVPVELGNLIQLQTLWLSSNQLSGVIPHELGNLENLTYLGLHNNNLSGPISVEIGNLLNLRSLVLYNNEINGSIPSELGNLTQLQSLWLYGNQLSGNIPDELGNLTQLYELRLEHNHLNGEFPASITNLVNLTSLTFDCWITSSDPSVIAFVGNLSPGWQSMVCVQSVVSEGAPVSSAAQVNFTVTFSDPVTGVDTSDFSAFMTGGLSGADVLSVAGGPSTYTVTVDTGIGNGTIRLDVEDNDTIIGMVGNPLGGSGWWNGNYTSGQTYAIIKTPTFGDVSDVYWSWGFVERLYNAGVTGGCATSPLRYCPENQVTRGQMAVFLLKGMYGKEYVASDATGAVFIDVPASNGFAKWIEQLAAQGITGGCGNGNYCPNGPVTREQMAVFLLVAEHGPGYTPPAASGVFADVPASNVYAPWIEQLAAEGITGGCGDGNYCPKLVVNRAQMAVFLVKAFNMP